MQPLRYIRIKTLTNLFKQDKEKFVVPKGVQDVIPVAAIFDDGIFKVGKDKYSKLIMQDETVIPTEQISVIQGEMFKGLYE